MATLRGFTGAIQKLGKYPTSGGIWSKPDEVSDGFEHHRFTLASTSIRPVTDVYELYWAHLFEQSSLRTFLVWLGRIAFRPLSKLPQRYQRKMVALRVAALVLGVAGLWLWYSMGADRWATLVAAVPAVMLVYYGLRYLLNSFFLGTISDAARYLDADPRNVEARNKVRKLGVDFLERLHGADRSYDRIIVCGHSLGSVIGYDILRYLWYRKHEGHALPDAPAQPVQKQVAALSAAGDGAAVRSWQRDLWLEQRELGNDWRISDFVTMGSPLAHADIVLADSVDGFDGAVSSGELPTCPSLVDPETKNIGFPRNYTSQSGQPRTIRLLGHAAMFSVTRWTNIHVVQRWLVHGDPISGPVAPLFGNGIRDIALKPNGRDGWFAHTKYWRGGVVADDTANPPQTALTALEAALDLNLKVMSPHKT